MVKAAEWPYRWSETNVEDADALVIVGGDVLVVAPEVVTSYAADGTLKWETLSCDTSGWTPTVVLGDTLVILSNSDDPVALNVHTGEIVDSVPDIVDPPQMVRLPVEYRYDQSTGKLHLGGVMIWSKESARDRSPSVARFGPFTIINDPTEGVIVVDEGGAPRVQIPLARMGDGDLPPVVLEGRAAVVSADGVLHYLEM